MGSSVTKPEELVKFRKVDTSLDNVEIPARAESRIYTDKKGLILYGIAVLILLPCLIYCLTLSDIRHLFRGADHSGNICGYKNHRVGCGGSYIDEKDYRDLPYSYNGKCVSRCPDEKELWFGECIDKPNGTHFNSFKRIISVRVAGEEVDAKVVFEETTTQWWKCLITAIITIVLCIFVLVILRFIPGPFVWGIMILSFLLLIIIDFGLWYGYDELTVDMDKRRVGLALAIVFTIFAFILMTIMICLLKKIGMVIQLYKETTKVLVDMPMLILVPIVMTIIQSIFFGIVLVTTAFLASSRKFVYDGEYIYYYKFTKIMGFTIFYNILIYIWTARIISGIQYMSVAGSVARWFFSRNKQDLDSPIRSSIRVTLQFHLGTIAFGSLILSLFAVVRAIIKSTIRNACCRCLVMISCNPVDAVLKFFSKNSYIETAIHGQSFLRSAKRASKLLVYNIASFAAVDCVGDFVLALIGFVVTVIATAISYSLFMDLGQMAVYPTFVCFIINLIIVVVTFGTFQTIIDTLFICFCEDSLLNDGATKPYFMSSGLMEFVENSKKLQEENMI